MSQFVLDCSVAAAWFLPDEFNEYADRVLDRLVTQAAIVPRLWYWEIGNVVCINERRKRLTVLQAEQILYRIDGLPVEVDRQEVDVAFQEKRSKII